MLNKDLKKEILKLIIFTVSLVFIFIYIEPIWRFLGTLLSIIMPFILGLIIAFVLNVLVNFIERKFFSKSKMGVKSKHNLSIILALALVISFLTFLSLLIIPQIKNTADIFITNLPVYEENVKSLLDNIGVNESVRASIIESTEEFVVKATDYMKNHSSDIIENVLGIATNVVSSIVNITVGIIFAIYLLIEKDKLLRQFRKILKAYLPDKKVLKINNITQLSNKTFARFVSGQVLEAFIIGILCLIGMLILRIPYAASVSVLVGFTALIPVFGAFIGTAIGAFLIFMVSPVKALIFIIFVIVLQQFEGNLIYPKVVGKSVNLPSIWVLVAVTVGASISGVVGMLVSVPICSILYSVIATNVRERLEMKEKINPKSYKKVKIKS